MCPSDESLFFFGSVRLLFLAFERDREGFRRARSLVDGDFFFVFEKRLVRGLTIFSRIELIAVGRSASLGCVSSDVCSFSWRRNRLSCFTRSWLIKWGQTISSWLSASQISTFRSSMFFIARAMGGTVSWGSSRTKCFNQRESGNVSSKSVSLDGSIDDVYW